MIVLLGDSLSVGALPVLKSRQPDVEGVVKVGAAIPWMDGQVDAVVAKGPKLVLVMGGTNDLAGVDVPTALSRLLSLASRLKARGLRPIVSTVPPVRTTNAEKTRDFNRAILGGALGDVEVVDVGGMVAESELGADGIHPKSYTKLGNGWADVVAKTMTTPTVVSVGTSLGAEDGAKVVGGVIVALGAMFLLSAVYRSRP